MSNSTKEFRDALLSEMEAAGFDRMNTAQRYRLISEAVMRRFSGQLENVWRRAEGERTAYYFSAEFLVGRLFYDALRTLGLFEDVREAVEAAGGDMAEFEEIPDHALGNGGLGRLAACFLDSAAAHSIPLCGYGIRYGYGFFRQDLSGGYQREWADYWQRFGDPWSVRRDSETVEISLGGDTVLAVPYDYPVFGEGGGMTVLRLWQAEAPEPFDYAAFNGGDYPGAVSRRERAERITQVLYPNDSTEAGRRLRLSQQIFFTDASVEDILRRFSRLHGRQWRQLPDMVAAQLNDTHPVLAIPSFIYRLEERGVLFEEALRMAREIFAYTNHTVMGEALEVWDAGMLRDLAPRQYAVIEKIQECLTAERQKTGSPGADTDILCGDRIHMARLAAYVSHSINGVAAIHTEILCGRVLRPWYEAYPEKFNNKTNGITQRRWLATANAPLAAFVTERIGDGWLLHADELARLRPYADDRESVREFARIKEENKRALAQLLGQRTGIAPDPEMLFDVQIKRLHEYKRQLMNAFSVLYLYRALKAGAYPDFTPTAFLFGAKSAPGYARAKGIIRYILAIAEKVNHDPAVKGKMCVIFVPDYNVSWAEKLIAAGDLSEQISMAGTEASGTGNMKLMLNGAPTLGTYDGANIEICQAAGEENNYFFGPTAAEMAKRMESYDPMRVYQGDARLASVVDSLVDGSFDDGGSGIFRELHASLLQGAGWHRADNYCVLGDFRDYLDTKLRALSDYRDREAYARRGLLNTAAAGRFSSDRTVQEYASEIWHV